MSDASTRQTPARQRSMLTGSNSESISRGNDELDDIEASGGRSNRKRQRQHPKASVTHQCEICQRTYERADRLSRHLMTHENARRYQCQRCQKSFNRPDLLTRHMITHDRNDGSGPDHGSINRTDRVGQACLACAAAKARCENNKPCRRCQSKSITCEVPNMISKDAQWQMSDTRVSQSRSPDTFNGGVDLRATQSLPSRQQRQQSRQQARHRPQQQLQQHVAEGERSEVEGEYSDGNEEEVDQDEENGEEPHQQQQERLKMHRPVDSASATEQQPTGLILRPGQSSSPRGNQLPIHSSTMDHGVAPQAWVETLGAQVETYDMHPISLDENQLVFDNIMNEVQFMPYIVDFNNQNLDTELLNFTFQDTQLDMFPAPPVLENNNNNSVGDETAGRSPRLTRDVRAGYAAFKRSPWLWTPRQLDHVLQDGENLTLDEDSMSSALTPNSSNLVPNVPTCGLPTIKPAIRDKMFYLVATMDKYTNRIPDFPSLDVINHVVEAFFVRQAYQVDNWIHIPSVLEFIPELGLAMVVAGSAVIAVPAIWKMGLVLQDVVRIKLGELWERQNSATRNLQPLQAFMLSLDAGLWSGFQRQMELAESFAQPLITMMRRGGMFGPTADTQSLVPHESDKGKILEAKWKKWIHRESFKRLSIHLFLHDTRASIALQKSPLISVTDITISLPASQIFYLAGSATEWKSCFHGQRVPPLAPASIQLADVMRDMSVLDHLHSEIDVALCYTAAAHGFWGQIWAFRESWKFYDVDVDKDSVHRLWLMTQQRELYQQVKIFEEALVAKPIPQYELLIIIELLLMILHVSAEELTRFAGKYGEEAASKAFVSLDRWSVTEQSRKAVWHAGQVLRWASVMPPAELRDFYAIAVYFASLALWAFGHLSTSKSSTDGSVSRNASASMDSNSKSTFVFLNGDETSGARSFIAGRQITPALTGAVFNRPGGQDSSPVQLSDPNAVLQMARDLYRNNFPFKGEPLPPLVENIGNLMRDLGSLPQSRFSRCVSPIE